MKTPGFVDIHSHVLWGTDDGSQSFEMSLEMVRLAAESGTSDIVATPHSDDRFSFDPDEVERKIQVLQEACGSKPRIHRGCDFHLHFENIKDCLENHRKYTINHLRYLMVEFSHLNIPSSIDQVFAQMKARGITPVITHPERNPLLMAQPGLIGRWIGAGCTVQITAQSYFGRFGKAAKAGADHLTARRMVHFVSSDAHDTINRPPLLRPAYDYVSEQWGEEMAWKLLVVNPQAVLTGTLFRVDIPVPEPSPRKWYQLW